MGSRRSASGALAVVMVVVAAMVADGAPVRRSAASVDVRPGEIHQTPDTTDDLAALVAWGIERFSRAGLAQPEVARTVTAPCTDDDSASAWVTLDREGAVVTLCEDLQLCCRHNGDPEVPCSEVEHCLLHEMAHVWIDAHVDDATKERFLAHSGATAWADPADPWHARGVEQAAETLAWALLQEPGSTPTGSESACIRRTTGFAILTGRRSDVDCERCAPAPVAPGGVLRHAADDALAATGPQSAVGRTRSTMAPKSATIPA